MLPVLDQQWDVTPKESVAIQRELLPRLVCADSGCDWRLVAGIDVGIKGDVARAAIAVLSFPQLELVDQSLAERPVSFPYVPGLLTFREAPVVLDALAKLESTPDVLIFDGQGYAHPRRMGIATHLGIVLDHPSVGCAKSRLVGHHDEPGEKRGDYALLHHGYKDQPEEVIGAVLRTRTRVKPVYVSIGHRMTLERSIELVLACGGGVRLPEPTRRAHRLASGV